MAIYKELRVIASCPFSSPYKEASSYTTPFEHYFKYQAKTNH